MLVDHRGRGPRLTEKPLSCDAAERASDADSTLIATFRLKAGSNALSTTPIPPRPSTPLTSYVPILPNELGQSDGVRKSSEALASW